MARLTIPDEQTFATFTVVTSTTAFPITFSLFAKADLTVLVDDVALDQSAFTFAGTLLDGGGYDGGTVTLNVAVSSGTVRIERNVSPERTSNFAPASAVPVQSVDLALNRLTAQDQDHSRRLGEAETTLDDFSDDVTDTAAAAVAAEAARAAAVVAKVAAELAETNAETAETNAEAAAVLTAADRVQTGLDRVATAADVVDAETARDAAEVSKDEAETAAAAVASTHIFPGRFVVGILASEAAALPRVQRLTLYGANPSKFYTVKQMAWKDPGTTRFTVAIQEATDADGTGAADVCSYTLSSGADVWTGLREITLAEVSASGVTATLVIDFTDTAIMEVYGPTDAATFQRRRINPTCLDSGVAQSAALTLEVEAVVTPLLPTAMGQRKPFLDTHDATGTVMTAELMRAFVKNIHVYGPNRTSNIRISYMRLSEAATCFITLYDEDKGREIVQWNSGDIDTFANRSRYVMGDIARPNLQGYSGELVFLELDWSVLTGAIDGPFSNMTRGGIHPDCLHSFASCRWWAENPIWHDRVYIGPTRTYTTLAAALAAQTRPCHPYHSVLFVFDENTTDYVTTTTTTLPNFTGLQGPGMYAVAGLKNSSTASTNAVLDRNSSTHVFDLRITSDTGDGTPGSGQYCIHHDPVNNYIYGSDAGGQTWGVLGGMENVLLVGGVNNDAPLYGSGKNSGLIEVWDNVQDECLHPTRSTAPYFAHDTKPEASSGGIYAANSRHLLPATWIMRNCSSQAIGYAAVQLASLGSGAEVPFNLVLDNCDFNLITQTLSAGTVHAWQVSGVHDGAILLTGGTPPFPNMGKLRSVTNSTGSSIPAGRAVKYSGARTISLCGLGEKPDGWTVAAIANGAIGEINTAKSIATAYLDGATASTGAWGLDATGAIDYAAATKLGRTMNGVVTVW